MARHPGYTMLLMLLGAFFSAGCGTVAPMSSAWRLRGATIDSAERDWKSQFTEINDTHVFIGMQNDSAYFYIRLLAPDEQFRRQIAGPGMTVWLEPQGGRKTGILYPMGTGMRDLEILGEEENDRTLYSTLEAPGIRVRIGSSEGSSMYELKVPLLASRDAPYAVGAAPGASFKIEIKTEKEVAGSRGEGMGEGGGRYPGGGFGGGGRRGGGMGGGGRGGRAGAGVRFDPINFSAEVHLAPPPGTR